MPDGQTVGSIFMNTLNTVGLMTSAVSQAKQYVSDKKDQGVQKATNIANSVYNSKIGKLARTGTKMGITSMKMANKASSVMVGGLSSVAKSVIGMPKLAKGLLSKGMGILGINIGISALLRQSQIFTSTLGALFQILGGFVDVILAPFMPLFAKVIQTLGDKIPWVAEMAQKGFDWLEGNVFPIIKNLFGIIIGKFAGMGDWLSEKWALLQEIFGIIQDNFPAIKTWFLTEVWGRIKPVLDFIWNELEKTYEWFKNDMLPIFSDIFDWLVPTLDDVYNFIVDDMFPIVSRMYDEVRDFYKNFLETTFNIVHSLWDIAWPLVKPIIVSLGEIAVEFMDWVNNELFPIVNKIVDTFMPHLEDILKIVRDTIQPILDEFMDEIFHPMWEAVKPWIDLIIRAFDNIILPVGKMILWVIGKVIVKLIWPLIKAIFDVITFILKAPFWIYNKILDPFFGWIKTGWDWIAPKVANMMAWGLNFMADVLDVLKPFGDHKSSPALRMAATELQSWAEQKQQKPQEVSVNVHITGDQISEHDKYMSNEAGLARQFGLSSFDTSGMTLNPSSPSGGYYS